MCYFFLKKFIFSSDAYTFLLGAHASLSSVNNGLLKSESNGKYGLFEKIL